MYCVVGDTYYRGVDFWALLALGLLPVPYSVPRYQATSASTLPRQ